MTGCRLILLSELRHYPSVMNGQEILDVLASNPEEEITIVDGSGRRFLAEIKNIEREEPSDEHTVISVRLEPTAGIDSTAVLIGYTLPASENWMLNLHYRSLRLPEMERVDQVEITGENEPPNRDS